MWEPGRRLAWKSFLDDVTIDVRFDPTATGTIVRLDATVSEGGEDRGGSSFVTVTPSWFREWMGKRDTAPREAHDLARVALTLHYARPAAAARWLADAFGFESPSPLPEGEDPLSDEAYGFPWIEFHVGGSSLMVEPLADPTVDLAQVTHVPWVFVNDLVQEIERQWLHVLRGARPRGTSLALCPSSSDPAPLSRRLVTDLPPPAPADPRALEAQRPRADHVSLRR